MSFQLGVPLSWGRLKGVEKGSLWSVRWRGTVVVHGSSPRGPRYAFQVSANRDTREVVEDALKKSNEVVDGVVEWVPAFVPRTAAKIGVTFFALSIIGSLFQKVLSTVVFFAVVISAGYILFQSSAKNDKTRSPDSNDDDDDDDPIAQANRIMDKYR